jgi:hypothetical protein
MTQISRSTLFLLIACVFLLLEVFLVESVDPELPKPVEVVGVA